MTIRILVADDHAIVRQGIKRILEEEQDLRVAGEAARSEEVLDLVRTHRADVLLLDLAMPGRGGLEVLKQIKGELPRLPVLILSVHPEDQFAVRVLKAGAAGYLTKDSAPEELVMAIRKVFQGSKYVSESLAQQLASDLAFDAEKPPHEVLSDREYQVLRLIGAGRTVGEIAESLYLSVKTVSTYRTRILEKLNLRNNAEMVRYAVERGLVR